MFLQRHIVRDCGVHSIDLFLEQGCPISTFYLSKFSLPHHLHASCHDKVEQNGQISTGWDIHLAMLIFICKVRRYVSPKTSITADVFYKLVAQMPSSCGSSIAPRDTYCPCRLLSRSSEISKSSGKKQVSNRSPRTTHDIIARRGDQATRTPALYIAMS